ncbi:hypothetical protein L7F22_027220 [Adiantum nelumboides]|nr:hypothetical protein [Adiantum nelumboides]
MPTAVRKRTSDVGGTNKGQNKRSKREDNNNEKGQSGSLSLKDLSITTSEQLVKTLKGGQESIKKKIAIANSAWRDTTVPVPRKEQLLAEWLLDTLNKEARNLKEFEAFGSAEVWNLLLEVLTDLTKETKNQSVGRYSIVSFLYALGKSINQVKDEQHILSLLQIAAQTISLISDNNVLTIEVLVNTFVAWFDVIGKYANQENCDDLAIPLSMLVRAWIGFSNTKKSKQILSEQDFLSSFCAALTKASSLPNGTGLHLRSCLSRVSFESFSPNSRNKIDYDVFIKQLTNIHHADQASIVFLQQRCLHIKGNSSLVEQAKERLEIWNTMASQSLKIAIEGNNLHTSTMGLLLKIISEKNLYPVESDDAKELLLRTLEYILSSIEEREITQNAFDSIRFIQQIDESIIDDASWKSILSSLALAAPSIPSRELLKSIVNTFSRTRTLDQVIELILVGSFEKAYSGKRSSKETEKLILQGTLLDSECWSSFIGPSLQNFVSIEQGHGILDIITRVLSNAISTHQGSTPHLGVALTFAGRVISVIAISDPARKETALKLGILYRDLFLPCVKGSLSQKSPERATSAIFAIECIISRLAVPSSIEAPLEWSSLFEEIESSQITYLLPLDQIPTHAPLQIQMLIAVLERCNRDMSKGQSTLFVSWLQDFFSDGKIDFNKLMPIQQIRTISQISDPAYVALDIVFSAYMPVIERYADVKLLKRLAQFAIGTTEKYPDCSLVTSILVNSANLELPRWQKFIESIKKSPTLHTKGADEIVSNATVKLGLSLSSMIENFDRLCDIEGAQAANVLYAPTFVQNVRQVSLEDYKEQLDKVQIGNDIPVSLPLLLSNGPEGSLSIAQNALDMVLARLAYVDGLSSVSVVQKLEAIAEGKTVLFRSRQVSPLLVIFTQAFENEKQNQKVFSSIVATLLTFIKLRSDILATLLPQISLLMGRIISHFQKIPNSNASGDRKIVQAREFTRLCSAITSRQSKLARGFSLHCLPIILSYVRALTSLDGIGIGEARMELERGIFALCGILANWQRDLLFDMMSDEAERIVARKLWRNFEAQRYKGE